MKGTTAAAVVLIAAANAGCCCRCCLLLAPPLLLIVGCRSSTGSIALHGKINKNILNYCYAYENIITFVWLKY